MRKIFTLLCLFLMANSAFSQDNWFNFLRKGTLSDDPVTSKFTNFTARFGNKGIDEKGVIVADPVDGEPALTVTTITYNYREQVFDSEGQPVLDANDEPTYQDYYKGEDGTLKDVIQDWDTQFHVAIPHKFKSGQKFKLKFWARASQPVQIYAQAHSLPGNYLNNLDLYQDLTTEWQPFVYEGEDGEGVDAIDGMQTVSFNCNTNKTDVISIYFRFDEFSCDIDDTNEDERTLQKESLRFPIPAVNADATFKLDLAPMMAMLGVEDLSAFLHETSMKVREIIEGEGEGATSIIRYSNPIQPTMGAYLSANGSMNEDGSGIGFVMPEDGINGTEANLLLFNTDLTLEKGKTIKTRMLFENNGWCYGYDMILMSQEDYDNPNSGKEGVIYSWESPDGTVIETGGKATFEGGDEGENRVNYKNTAQGVDYYTLSLNGKKDNIDDEEYQKNCTPRIIITLDDMFYGGEEIQVTAFTNKNDASKLSTPFFKFENGTTLFDDDKTFIDLGLANNSEAKPVTNSYIVPDDALGCKWFKMSRSKTSTNLFITKLVILGSATTGVAEVKQVVTGNGIVYNLAGQRVDDSYKGIVIKNGKKVLNK